MRNVRGATVSKLEQQLKVERRAVRWTTMMTMIFVVEGEEVKERKGSREEVEKGGLLEEFVVET